MMFLLVLAAVFGILAYYGLALYNFWKKSAHVVKYGDRIFGPKRKSFLGNIDVLPKDPFSKFKSYFIFWKIIFLVFLELQFFKKIDYF